MFGLLANFVSLSYLLNIVGWIFALGILFMWIYPFYILTSWISVLAGRKRKHEQVNNSNGVNQEHIQL